MSDEELAAKLARLASAFPTPAPRLEDHARLFHAGCTGFIVGELGKALTCSDCGKEMTAFVSADGEERLRLARVRSLAKLRRDKLRS